jgi:hypothetical protein
MTLSATRTICTPGRRRGGEIADRHVRFVFSNEPVERLALLGERVRRAPAAVGSGGGVTTPLAQSRQSTGRRGSGL